MIVDSILEHMEDLPWSFFYLCQYIQEKLVARCQIHKELLESDSGDDLSHTDSHNAGDNLKAGQRRNSSNSSSICHLPPPPPSPSPSSPPPPHPATVKAVMGGFLFLRFICPAMTTPHTYGVMADMPDANSRRMLVLVTKLLFHCATGVEFGVKEPYMRYDLDA